MSCMEIWGGNSAIDTSIQMPGLDAWVYAKPYKRSTFGGDVHYVSTCATGRITRLLLADVSGHGDEVDELAKLLRDLMRQFVNYLDQSRFVRMMNVKFTELSASNIFATALVTTFFSPTRTLTLCNAGHPAPLLYRAATNTWSLLETNDRIGGETKSDAAANIPLGILEFANYDQIEITLEIGDMMLCYTDSLIESADKDGQFLAPEGLLKLIREVPTTNPAQLIHQLLLAISSAAPGNLHEDDVTALLIRANGSAAKVAVRDKLLAPFRVLKGIAKSLVTGGKAIPMPELSIRNIGGAMIDRLSR